MHTPQRFRILLYNAGYETALDGSMRSYLLGFYRYLYTPQRIIRQVRQAIYHMLEREKPDIACFVELNGKKNGVPHPHAYPCSNVDSKYGVGRFASKIPFFRDNCNGFMSTGNLAFSKHYFKRGYKKLIYEIELHKDLSLFLVHFSIHRHVRKHQCDELKKILKTRKNVVLCGDFNIFQGPQELQSLAKACGLRIVNSLNEATFPSARPTKTFDLFLCPEGVEASVRVVTGIKASDHLPVLLEMVI
jgi:hypothetical protein